MNYAEKHLKGNNRKISWINSIRVRMILIILLASSLVVGISGFLAYRYFERVKTDQLSMLAEVTANRLAQHLITPMWDVNRERVGKLLEVEMGETNIVKIVVIDEDGKSIFAAKERTVSGIVNASNLQAGRNTFTGKRPIINGDQQLGHINVFISTLKIKQELSNIAKSIALLGFILGLALTIVTGFALSRLVVRPLRKLTSSAEQITKGNFSQQIDHSRQDEIGYLGATIDRMQYGLRVATMRLRKSVAKTV